MDARRRNRLDLCFGLGRGAFLQWMCHGPMVDLLAVCAQVMEARLQVGTRFPVLLLTAQTLLNCPRKLCMHLPRRSNWGRRS